MNCNLSVAYLVVILLLEFATGVSMALFEMEARQKMHFAYKKIRHYDAHVTCQTRIFASPRFSSSSRYVFKMVSITKDDGSESVFLDLLIAVQFFSPSSQCLVRRPKEEMKVEISRVMAYLH